MTWTTKLGITLGNGCDFQIVRHDATGIENLVAKEMHLGQRIDFGVLSKKRIQEIQDCLERLKVHCDD